MKKTLFEKCKYLPESDEEWYIPKEALIANTILNSFEDDQRSVIEVGVLHGAWSINILRNIHETIVYGIDPYPNMSGMREDTLNRLKDFNFTLSESWNDLVIKSSVSVVHIDGLHTEDAVYEDLVNAEKFLGEKGVIIVDDCLQPVFPGVAAGWIRFILNSYFSVFLCTGSKAYITRKKDHAFWIDRMRNAFSNQNIIPWCNHLGEDDDPAYISYPTIDGYKLLLSFDRTDPNESDPILPEWPEQPIVPMVQPKC